MALESRISQAPLSTLTGSDDSVAGVLNEKGVGESWSTGDDVNMFSLRTANDYKSHFHFQARNKHRHHLRMCVGGGDGVNGTRLKEC